MLVGLFGNMIQVLRTDDFVFREVEDADLDQLAVWIRGDLELDFFERYDTRISEDEVHTRQALRKMRSSRTHG